MKDKIDTRDTLVTLLKDKYAHEYNRKKYFDDALGVPITISSFLIGGIYYVVNESSTIENFTFRITFEALTGLLLLVCVITFFFLFRVYFTYTKLYRSFPDSKEITDYYNKLKVHHIESGKKDNSADLENCLDDHLKKDIMAWYVKSNSKNLIINESRGQNFIYAKIFLGIALILGILIFSLTCLNKSFMAKETTQSKPPPPEIRRDKASSPKKIINTPPKK